MTLLPPPPPHHHLLLITSDITTASSAALVVLLSLVSLVSLLRLHLSSSSSPSRRLGLHSLTSLRLLLILSATLLSLIEFLRLPSLRPLLPHHHHSLRPLLPHHHHSLLCKTQLVLSLGLLQPFFFSSLLSLLSTSLTTSDYKPNQRPKALFFRALSVSLWSSFPSLFFQVVLAFFPKGILRELGMIPSMPATVTEIIMGGAAVDSEGGCPRPLASTAVVAVFGAMYVQCFLAVCVRTAEVVINRRLRKRVWALAAAVTAALVTQVAALVAAGAVWRPGEAAYEGMVTVAFVGVAVCVAVGEGILVIRPVADALAVGRGGDGRRSACGGVDTC
ncbi:hypothetical protein QJS04_geneDACA016282 [Acorus gramineus]|uniref:Uncharacterized protein n=1 Tax=Acorus gramineus TaxID=55184 RepID=A0AAV9A0E3_ACOGR|nr:hypothetical protein QJS04_geneDACA016282 [Acorus gramineus]